MCVVRGSEGSTPETIVDTSTLKISIDNRGIAQLSVTVLNRTQDTIQGSCSISVGTTSTFKGSIVNDNPRELPGTGYIEHSISAIGMIE